MSLLFWRKTTDVPNESSVAVTETNPLPVQLIHLNENDVPPVRIEQESYLPPVAGVSITRRVQVPGIGTGSAYTAADAFGTLITIPNVFRPNKNSGIATKILFYDLDDEGIQKDCIFFGVPISTTANDDAYAPSDGDILSGSNGVSITTFFNWANNQMGVWNGSAWVESMDTNLYVRLITQGADNIAAGSIPWLSITIIPD